MKLIIASVLLLSSAAIADCPKHVSDAIAKAYPKAEVDVSPDGKILQVEEVVRVDQVPSVVMKAFAAKYPRAKATRAEKQTADKTVTYEIAFEVNGQRKEATFDANGKFAEVED